MIRSRVAIAKVETESATISRAVSLTLGDLRDLIENTRHMPDTTIVYGDDDVLKSIEVRAEKKLP